MTYALEVNLEVEFIRLGPVTTQVCIVQVGNRSSEFHPEMRRVRRSGSYIYEEFMPTGGTDVKVCADAFLVEYSIKGVFSFSSNSMYLLGDVLIS